MLKYKSHNTQRAGLTQQELACFLEMSRSKLIRTQESPASLNGDQLIKIEGLKNCIEIVEDADSSTGTEETVILIRELEKQKAACAYSAEGLRLRLVTMEAKYAAQQSNYKSLLVFKSILPGEPAWLTMAFCRVQKKLDSCSILRQKTLKRRMEGHLAEISFLDEEILKLKNGLEKFSGEYAEPKDTFIEKNLDHSEMDETVMEKDADTGFQSNDNSVSKVKAAFFHSNLKLSGPGNEPQRRSPNRRKIRSVQFIISKKNSQREILTPTG